MDMDLKKFFKCLMLASLVVSLVVPTTGVFANERYDDRCFK